MVEQGNYRWPSKLRKFKIDDPFQRLLVAKYEDDIPWQSPVVDPASLDDYLNNHLLPELLGRVAYPPLERSKHYYLSSSATDLQFVLDTDQELDAAEIEILQLIAVEDGEAVAASALLEILNTRKRDAFEQWVELLNEKYAASPAFQLLIMRPIFSHSRAGTRRPVVPPSHDVLDWLYRRISGGGLTPNDSVARIYCWKLGAGLQRIPHNGWQFISRGIDNAQQLAAASRGSGWCVAAPRWAARYLEDGCFYILRSEGRPVVALRTAAQGKAVLECRGRNNEVPAEWLVDIELFLRTQKIALPASLFSTAAGSIIPAEVRHTWWRERVKYWPFAGLLAPADIADALVGDVSRQLVFYTGFPAFENLSASFGITMGLNDWLKALEVDPGRYALCPEPYRKVPAIEQAVIRGWVERMREGEATLAEVAIVPAFVRGSKAFQDALPAPFLQQLRGLVRRRPGTKRQRRERLNLEEVLPVVPGEDRSLAVERALNLLLNNESDNFTDDLFTAPLRGRQDFATVREYAWLEACQEHPPLWFALPGDLAALEKFQPTETGKLRVDLEAWVEKVSARPWLLTQKSGVPKSIRQHRRVLETYRDSWLGHLQSTPWKIWLKSGRHRRVYMSYALLCDTSVSAALQAGWVSRGNGIQSAWFQASVRMRNMLVLQASVLKAINPDTTVWGYHDPLEVCLDVAERFERQSRRHPSNPHVEYIRASLTKARLFHHPLLLRRQRLKQNTASFTQDSRIGQH